MVRNNGIGSQILDGVDNKTAVFLDDKVTIMYCIRSEEAVSLGQVFKIDDEYRGILFQLNVDDTLGAFEQGALDHIGGSVH